MKNHKDFYENHQDSYENHEDFCEKHKCSMKIIRVSMNLIRVSMKNHKFSMKIIRISAVLTALFTRSKSALICVSNPLFFMPGEYSVLSWLWERQRAEPGKLQNVKRMKRNIFARGLNKISSKQTSAGLRSCTTICNKAWRTLKNQKTSSPKACYKLSRCCGSVKT